MRRAWAIGLILIVGACAAPRPSASPPAASAGAPTATSAGAPAATSVGAPPATFPAGPPAPILEVWGTVSTADSGGRWIGGTRYDAELRGPDGLQAAGRLVEGEGDTLTPAGSLPRWLAPGAYTISFTARPISDSVEVGATPDLGPVVASCSATFTAADPAVVVHVAFADRTCSVDVTDGSG